MIARRSETVPLTTGDEAPVIGVLGSDDIVGSSVVPGSDHRLVVPEVPLLSVEDLAVTFRTTRGEVHAVRGVSLRVDSGRSIGLVGESGCGKSATVRAIMGLLRDDVARVGGRVRFEGTELVGASERSLRAVRGAGIAMVFQDPTRALNPTIQVGRQIALAIRNHARMSRHDERVEALRLLRLVRIPAPELRMSQYPHELSGGMKQRVVIAIALASKPKLLIADEATTALDVTTQAQIMDLIRKLQVELGMAAIIVSHNLPLTIRYTDDLFVMYAGRIVEGGVTRELADNPRMPYTKALLDSVPGMTQDRDVALHAIVGGPPSPAERVIGCAFAPRCESVEDRCRLEQPPLEDIGNRDCACWFPLPAHRSDGVLSRDADGVLSRDADGRIHGDT